MVSTENEPQDTRQEGQTGREAETAINNRIIDDIIEREGGAKLTNIPGDRGGRTQYGIAERDNPEAWVDQKVTLEEARDIYRRKYLDAPGFAKVEDIKLRAQLVDFGVNSGPAIAIQKLQGIVGAEVDGHLGPKTLQLTNTHPEPIRLRNQLALERVRMIGRIVQKNPSQAKFLPGWLERALSFWKP